MKYKFFSCAIAALLPALFLSAGCVTVRIKKYHAPLAKEKYAAGNRGNVFTKAPRPRFTDDVMVFSDLQYIDLNNDGTKEIVAIYKVKGGAIGVKVIKMKGNDYGEVVFKHIFSCLKVKFAVSGGIPAILTEENYPGTLRRLKKTYYWDGSAFSLKK